MYPQGYRQCLWPLFFFVFEVSPWLIVVGASNPVEWSVVKLRVCCLDANHVAS